MGTSNTRLSPRQKMINLMYIVLMAMLALNVSSDVLNGFSQVKDGLTQTNENIEQRNSAIIGTLEAFSQQNPEKGLPWYNKALEVRNMTSGIYNTVDSLKLQIVRRADGKNGSVDNIVNRENLDAASAIMLDPSTRRGESLRHLVDNYRQYIIEIVNDSIKSSSIDKSLSTMPTQRLGEIGQVSWEEYKFDNQPVVAAIALLTKLQNDIKFAEGEALQSLLANVDAGDVRVNELNAFVIPNSRFVMRGGKYQANIVLAAVDTTQRPVIFINDKQLPNDRGIYEITASSTGTFDYNGYLEVPRGDGSMERHQFNSSYTVIEPTATVSATMMNVLYAGIDNPISISVPGVANNAVSASMTNGTLSRSGDNWVARPAKIGEDAVITVTADMDGQKITVAQSTFRVRKLPNPTPYIIFKDAQGNNDTYNGGTPGITRSALYNSPGIGAAIDDGVLNIPFQVLSFEITLIDSNGDNKSALSNGANFSPQQIKTLREARSLKRFFISKVRAKGPDGVERNISPIEVFVK